MTVYMCAFFEGKSCFSALGPSLCQHLWPSGPLISVHLRACLPLHPSPLCSSDLPTLYCMSLWVSITHFSAALMLCLSNRCCVDCFIIFIFPSFSFHSLCVTPVFSTFFSQFFLLILTSHFRIRLSSLSHLIILSPRPFHISLQSSPFSSLSLSSPCSQPADPQTCRSNLVIKEEYSIFEVD